MQFKNETDNKTGRQRRRPLHALKSNFGITLIALIITIIVLLILAGVTLNMVMGDSGIFNKANSAKEQTQKSTAEEIIKLAVLENEANKVSEKNYLENDKLKEEITQKLEEQGYKVEENDKVIYYEDKTINIEDYLTKEETKEDTLKTTNITAQDVQKHPDWYYGKKVTNYTSANGQNDWRIFYSDGTHIFLITGDYINTTETNRINSNTGMTTSRYCAYWASNSVPSFQTVEDEVLTRFKVKEYTLQSGINNSKCVSTLLNANNWSSYKDSGNKAEKAIGSPTVEMWMDSWNTRYTNNSDQIYRKASTSTSYPGYYVGTSEDPTGSYYIDNSVMNKKEGYNNKLYYPHTSSFNSCNGYWLASPSAYGSSDVLNVNYGGRVLFVYCGGGVSYNGCDTGYLGVRPVVSLNSGITVNATDAE